MSIEYLNLAFKAKVDQSTTKFLLVALAAHSDDEGLVQPLLVQDLEELTSLDRKTVIEGMLKLQRNNYIKDTGERFGATNQGRIWQLNISPTPRSVANTAPRHHLAHKITVDNVVITIETRARSS